MTRFVTATDSAVIAHGAVLLRLVSVGAVSFPELDEPCEWETDGFPVAVCFPPRPVFAEWYRPA